jgi:DNA-binding transcriptional regulator of glucitol operon
VALIVAFCLLGRWQWHRAVAPTGGVQNYGYAFEWPLFAAFVVFGWWRLLREELQAERRPGSAPDGVEQEPQGATARALASRRQVRPAPEADEPPDEELASYNRYLAWLHERDQRATGRS